LFTVNYPKVDNTEKELLFNQLRSLEVTEEVVESLLKHHKSRAVANTLAMAALDYADGKVPLEKVLELTTELEVPAEVSNTKFVTDDLEALLEEMKQERGLRWRLKVLNNSLGSLRRGDFGFVFARVETGKTAFVVSEMTHMARQTDKNVLYICNEEAGQRLMLRMYMAAFGKTMTDILAQPARYRDAWNNEYGGRIKLFDTASVNRREVDAIVKDLQPGLVIIDQLDKIRGFSADRYDLQLKAAYQWGRELAKEYCPVIGVSQASGSGEGKKWLNMDDIDSSKTGKPGEADFIIGIGKDDEMENLRYLSILKNKLSGDEDSDPALRHGHFECIILPEVSRYGDVR
jgi:replicative DNA helicase